MAAITKIEFWSDVGFIDGAVEIPRLNAADPTSPDMVIEPDDPIMPSKDRFFSELKLKEYYTGLLTMSYMRITYDLKNSLGIDTLNVFYGWVDKVDLSSDGEYPMTTVSWHIDEWRTWKNAVTFGSGHVKRRPYKDLATTPIQNYHHNYLKVGSTDMNICPVFKTSEDVEIWWVIFSYNTTSGGSSIINRMFYPVRNNGSGGYLWFTIYDQISNSTKSVHGPSVTELLNGLSDERFGIAPEELNGVWLSPLPPKVISPAYITGSGNSKTDPLVLSGVFNGLELTSENGAMFASDAVRTPVTYTSITSSEEERFVLTDGDGHKIGDIPYGMDTSKAELTIFCEPDGPYIEISFDYDINSYGNLEGMTFVYPLPHFPVNTNAYSSYVYSGQQDYDREMRTVRSNASAWKASAAGGGSGAMMGAFGPVGLAVGAAGGVSGGLIGYGVEMLYQNDEEQRLEDRLQADQLSSLIMGSNVIQTVLRQFGLRIKSVVPDPYSATQITNTRAQFGVSVDELMSSCDALIRSTSPTGYYNIQNMIVNGNVPVSAKKWIREKFRSGVRLI